MYGFASETGMCLDCLQDRWKSTCPVSCDGTMGTMFTLKFPFRLPQNQGIDEVEATKEADGLTFSLVGRRPYCILTISGFQSAENASKYTSKVWAGLMWNLLERGLAPSANMNPQEVTYADDPMKAAENLSLSFGAPIAGPVDGLIDGASPAVYETSKKMRTITGGDATITVTSNSSNVLEKLVEGATFTLSGELISDDKLKVALELYGAFFTESSGNARFLTLIMALEALTTGEARPRIIQNLFNGWETHAQALISDESVDAEDKEALNAIVKEMLHKKEDSLRSQIRRLVKTCLMKSGAPDAVEASRKALELYDLRSTLVHTGHLPAESLATALAEAKDIVYRVLRSMYLSRAVE